MATAQPRPDCPPGPKKPFWRIAPPIVGGLGYLRVAWWQLLLWHGVPTSNLSYDDWLGFALTYFLIPPSLIGWLAIWVPMKAYEATNHKPIIALGLALWALVSWLGGIFYLWYSIGMYATG